MIKSKGCLDLLEACKILMDKGVDFGCTFIGEETEGITKKSFEKEISNRNLKNYVQYLGNIPEDDIHGYLGIADIFAYPTYNEQESVPIVLLEAMEQALPCVATKEEGITSIIEDGVTGFLVDKQCPNKLAECLEKLIQDPELRKDMGREAKCRFEEKYTLTIFERNFMNCINQCI